MEDNWSPADCHWVKWGLNGDNRKTMVGTLGHMGNTLHRGLESFVTKGSGLGHIELRKYKEKR